MTRFRERKKISKAIVAVTTGETRDEPVLTARGGNAAQVRLTREVKRRRRKKERERSPPSRAHRRRGSVDLPFAFDRDILDFPTEYSRYHLSAWISDGSLIRLNVVPVNASNATIQQNSCFNLVALRAEGTERWAPIGNTGAVTGARFDSAPLSPSSRQRDREGTQRGRGREKNEKEKE
ncbi:hypothetical protein DBV15_07523 [Temnothorax longispinosus]|uniref:Uncharacterized protein n=1 Tax=Temnothorax longispinosus TaxID=300112 RepID=A0A4S2JVV4_9HYME|nr:hypothetical protein DBV15_07523 [Temnothorax longispinosus]